MAESGYKETSHREENNSRYNRSTRGQKFYSHNQRGFNKRNCRNSSPVFADGSVSQVSTYGDRNIFKGVNSQTEYHSSSTGTASKDTSSNNVRHEHSNGDFFKSHSERGFSNNHNNKTNKTTNYKNTSQFSGFKKKYRQFQNTNNYRPTQTDDNATSEFVESESNDNRVTAEFQNIRHSNDHTSFNDSENLQDSANQPLNSQRGTIVGGRYIRKHTSNSVPHSYSHKSFESERHLKTAKPQRIPQSFDTKKKTYYNFEYERDYAYENASNFGAGSSNKSFSSNRKYENISSNTDVYHYSSKPDHVTDEKINKSSTRTLKETNSKISQYKEDNANQRELLILHLNKGESECLVCCERIRIKDQTWHCLSCYHVFHLRCIRKWARSPTAIVEGGGWRCPACQSLTSKVPYDYFCFCGKQKNPDINYHITPHSCGEICNRKKLDCSHLCKELCHPGPCPPCVIVVQKACACGKTFKTTTCKQSSEETCGSTCDKLLNCGVHFCKSLCHLGECEPCEIKLKQECFCEKDTRIVSCTQESSKSMHFSCGNSCEKLLNCLHHKCQLLCHSGDCENCSLSIEVVKFCPCGKSTIEEITSRGQATIRKSCEDPIPVCNEKCEKILFCGPKDNPHWCQSPCHTGECPPCPLSTSTKCRCGAFTKEFKCTEISQAFVYSCEKRCNKRRECGRHKCLNKCCINTEHKCELICNKKLSCGNHQCQEPCHAGNCHTCWNVSFDELRCHCGESVSYPPIQCGEKPPECSKPCIRSHECKHEVKHTCHSDEICPPCTSLTTKWCFGHHKQCGSVMCFLDGVSCGMQCQKPLPCGKHECQLTCHAGSCLKPGEKCSQTCTIFRLSCGHPCGNTCHEGTCPDTPCKTTVTLMCPCGHRSENTTCYDSTKSYYLMSVSVLATKMQEIKDGQTVNLNDVLGKKSKNNKLQCNEECAIIERNKRLAVALQIQNPDLSCSPGPPNYSEFLKSEAKKHSSFVSDVYNKISDLVQLAKESKQKCRSHSFPPMNRDQRHVVHELAEFFGCETQSYDEEPKKNVVVTAYKNKCWLPFVSIMTVVQRDMGLRKGPVPVLAQRDTAKNSPGAINMATPQKKKIDYFDYKEKDLN